MNLPEINSVRALRAHVLAVARRPAGERDAHIENIRTAAQKLGATELPWMKNWLAGNPAPAPTSR